MRPLGVIGHLSRDIVAGGTPRIGGGPWHASRGLRALRHDALVFAKCGERPWANQLATLGLPFSSAIGGETTAFSFSYDDAGVRTMAVDAVGEPWRLDELPQRLLRGITWLHIAPLLHGDFEPDALEWLARDRFLLFDGQGLVRTRATGELELNGSLDRSMLEHVTILKLSDEEAAAVPDVDDLDVPEILLTHGPAGSTLVTREGRFEVPAHAVDTDPTGAGDAFSAAYVASRADGHRPLSAARRATALVGALLAGQAR